MKGHSVCQSVGKLLSGKGYNYVGLLGSHETDRQIPNPRLGAVFLICRGQPAVISLIIPSTFLFRSSMPFHVGCFCSAVFTASSRYPTSQPNTSQSPRTHICLSYPFDVTIHRYQTNARRCPQDTYRDTTLLIRDASDSHNRLSHAHPSNSSVCS